MCRQIRDLDRLTPDGRLAGRPDAHPDRGRPHVLAHLADHLVRHPIGGTPFERLARLVELIDGARIGTGQARGVRDDRGQDLLKI